MNEQIINELLEQLKSNLENVESAKQQVEKTVGAYNALEGQVDGFVRELGFITQNTRTIINQLEEVKKNFLSNVSDNLEKKIISGVNEINSNVENAKNINTKNSNNIISNLNTNTSDINSKITNGVESLSNQLHATRSSIMSEINNSTTTTTNLISGSEKRLLQQIKEKGDSIKTNIDDSTESIKGAVYWAIGFSFITLCLVIYILTKI